MSGERGKNHQDQLFWSIAKGGSFDQILLLVEDHFETSKQHEAYASSLDLLKATSHHELSAQWAQHEAEFGSKLDTLEAYSLLLRSERDPEYQRQLELAAKPRVESSSCFWFLFEFLQLKEAILRRALRQAKHHLSEMEAWCSRQVGSFSADIADSFYQRARGLYFQLTGNYTAAFESFRSALESSRALKLSTSPIVAQEFATLLWASGQLEEALRLHTDPVHRGELHQLSWESLLRSHLSAAKCAIDNQAFEVSESELRAADQLLREAANASSVSRGYFYLYQGEHRLSSMSGDPKIGFDDLERACRSFEQLDPPFHAGLLDAKISITQFAIRNDDHARMLQVLHNILAEAEENGCLEARARCMVLESSLFVSENPPLRKAFDNLITRLHLINNPALLLQALGNLFIYSLRHLEQPDQAFLMGRLRNLQRVLEESCYQDLYEKYIEQNYSWAIESRLAEFLEQDDKLTRDDENEPTT